MSKITLHITLLYTLHSPFLYILQSFSPIQNRQDPASVTCCPVCHTSSQIGMWVEPACCCTRALDQPARNCRLAAQRSGSFCLAVAMFANILRKLLKLPHRRRWPESDAGTVNNLGTKTDPARGEKEARSLRQSVGLCGTQDTVPALVVSFFRENVQNSTAIRIEKDHCSVDKPSDAFSWWDDWCPPKCARPQTCSLLQIYHPIDPLYCAGPALPALLRIAQTLPAVLGESVRSKRSRTHSDFRQDTQHFV